MSSDQQARQQLHRQPQAIARTRQDLINSGELFRTNKKYSKERASNASIRARRGLSECCYSLSNLILIVASVIALVFLFKFFLEEPLARYYEYLLSLAFCRQMIFVIVLMFIVLLVPVFNAASAFLSAGRPKSDAARQNSSLKTILKVKLSCLALLILLVFVALVFVAPNVRSENLAGRLELELRKFMRKRYESEFLQNLVDDVQEEYECCDQMWYRANLRDQLPLSCFVPNTNFSLFFERTCSDALSSLIGTRCYIIAACLVVILVALASLFAIDLTESFAQASGHYEIHRDSPTQPAAASRLLHQSDGSSEECAPASDQKLLSEPEDKTGSQSLFYREPTIGERLKLEERERETTLAASRSSADTNRARSPNRPTFGRPLPPMKPALNDSASLARSQSSIADSGPQPANAEPILLARANYQLVRRERSKSPIFVAPQPNRPGEEHADRQEELKSPERRPIKSVLKKTTSNSSNIDIEAESSVHLAPDVDHQAPRGGYEDEMSSDDDYTERLRQSDSLLRQKQLQREQQTRRSLLSVRFADED